MERPPSALEALQDAWADALAKWAIPEEYIERIDQNPFELLPESFVPDLARRDTPSMRAAISALSELEPGTRSLLDVGCASGGTSLILFPPAEHLIAVDQSPQMLDRLRENAAALGIANSSIEIINSAWPTATAATAPVVTCANVLYNVSAPIPFIEALIGASTYAVVIELTARHPHFSANPIWKYFYGYRRPIEPNYQTVIEMIKLLGYDPAVETWHRNGLDLNDEAGLTRLARRSCIPQSQLGELRNYLKEHPIEPTEVVSITFRT